MAASKQSVVRVVIVSIATVLSFIAQMFGIILISNINKAKPNNAIMAMLAKKRSYLRQKLKRCKLRSLNRRPRSRWHKPSRTDLWWENIRTGVAPGERWTMNFRMSRDSFIKLEDELSPYISPDPNSPNYRSLRAQKKVAVTLYVLKDTGSLSMTANSFEIAINTASAVITKGCQVISLHLGPKYLHLPEDQENMQTKVSEFETKFAMTQAFGCIDGTHIPIQCPRENSQDFYCYKQYYSLNVQAVCDYKGYFMDVECMWPGIVHDAKVFTNFAVNAKLRENKLPSTFQTPVLGGAKIPNYLIGDPAYPLLPFCMKEYKTCVSNEEVIFNNMLRSARNPIECAFDRLKARWAILTLKMELKLGTIPTVIYACFVLHNYCENHNMYVDHDVVTSQIELMNGNEAQFRNNPDPVYSFNVGEGTVVRRTLTTLIHDTLS